MIQASQVYVDPSYDGNPFDGGDVAVIHLSSPAPASAQRYDIDRRNDQMGQAFTFEGYGLIGFGATGSVNNTYGTLHSGENKFELTGNQVYSSISSVLLAYDFDDGTPTHDAFGRMFGLNDLGLGNNEACAAPGDSGGPSFILENGVPVIGAVTTGGVEPAAASPSIEINAPDGGYLANGPISDFGTIGMHTSVSPYVSWIDSVTHQRRPGDPHQFDDQRPAGSGRAWPWTTRASSSSPGPATARTGWATATAPAPTGSTASSPAASPISASRSPLRLMVCLSLSPSSRSIPSRPTTSSIRGWRWMRRATSPSAGRATRTSPRRPPGFPRCPTATASTPSAMPVKRRFAAKTPNLGPNGEIGGEFEVNTTTDGNQRYPSIAVDDAGDMVIVWSGNGAQTGNSDPQGFFYQQFQQAADTAGPTVDEVHNIVSTTSPAQAQAVPPGINLPKPVTQFVVTFNENLNTTGGASGQFSVDNPNNWGLTKSGTNLTGGIAQVQFGYNELNKLYPSIFATTDK